MAEYLVSGFERTSRMMKVHASSEAEAIKKAQAGDYFDVDTEPGPCIDFKKWTAEQTSDKREAE